MSRSIIFGKWLNVVHILNQRQILNFMEHFCFFFHADLTVEINHVRACGALFKLVKAVLKP